MTDQLSDEQKLEIAVQRAAEQLGGKVSAADLEAAKAKVRENFAGANNAENAKAGQKAIFLLGAPVLYNLVDDAISRLVGDPETQAKMREYLAGALLLGDVRNAGSGCVEIARGGREPLFLRLEKVGEGFSLGRVLTNIARHLGVTEESDEMGVVKTQMGQLLWVGRSLYDRAVAEHPSFFAEIFGPVEDMGRLQLDGGNTLLYLSEDGARVGFVARKANGEEPFGG